MDTTPDYITSLAEDVEKATSIYKSIMFAENFGAAADITPELTLAFGEFAEVCRDFVELHNFYNGKPTPEEEAAELEANYLLAADVEEIIEDYVPVLDIIKKGKRS